MNRPYIEKMVNSYLIDNQIDKNKFEEYNNYVIEIVDYMKNNLKCAYTIIHEDMTLIEKQRYIYHLLDTKEEKLIQESGIEMGIYTLLGSVLPILLDRYGYEIVMAIKDKITKIRINLVDFIENKKDFTKYKVLDNMISSNFNDCRKKVGFAEDNKLKISLNVDTNKDSSWFNPNINQEDINKAQGFRDCYIEYIISMIASVTVIYSKCLEESGEDTSKIFDNGISGLLSIPTGAGCQVLYDQLKELHKSFIDSIDVFFKENQRERQNWINRLNDKIKTSKKGEFLRPSQPFREKSNYEKNKYTSGENKGFIKNKEVNPMTPIYKRFGDH